MNENLINLELWRLETFINWHKRDRFQTKMWILTKLCLFISSDVGNAFYITFTLYSVFLKFNYNPIAFMKFSKT